MTSSINIVRIFFLSCLKYLLLYCFLGTVFYGYFFELARLRITIAILQPTAGCKVDDGDLPRSSKACLSVLIKNTSLLPVMISGCRPAFYHFFRIQVKDDNGRFLPSKVEIGHFADPEDTSISTGLSCHENSIPPFASYSEDTDLTAEYDLKPGTYAVRVSDTSMVTLPIPFLGGGWFPEILFPSIDGTSRIVKFTIPDRSAQ